MTNICEENARKAIKLVVKPTQMRPTSLPIRNMAAEGKKGRQRTDSDQPEMNENATAGTRNQSWEGKRTQT